MEIRNRNEIIGKNGIITEIDFFRMEITLLPSPFSRCLFPTFSFRFSPPPLITAVGLVERYSSPSEARPPNVFLQFKAQNLQIY